MLDYILNFDYIIYIIWMLVWLAISLINTSIYRNYNTPAVEAFGTYAPNYEGNLLVFFTFRWVIDTDDTQKIVNLKKVLNRFSILFVLLTIFSATIFIYKLNQGEG